MKYIKKIKKIVILNIFLLVLLSSFAVFASCKKENSTPSTIKLFNTNTQTVEKLNFEDYIEGVVAGEMENDAPLEALKAQAVLARTFACKFMQTGSKYSGADISTDITEAAAYNKDRINDNIKKAVKETKGQTIKYKGELINAYFHANSGGKTASAKEGLNGEDLSYIKSVETKETSLSPWSATFSKDSILNALRNMGVSVSSVSSFKVGERGESGRAITFVIGGKEVNANTFRLNIGSTKLKSTLIDNISLNSSTVTISGKGYGHGVGLSQDYAKVLANEGKNYKKIINYFFSNVTIK